MRKIIVNGTFDILHHGHLAMLNHARILGDELNIAIDSDDRVKKLKGDDRPINSINDRLNLFKTIKYVDKIILYDESDINKEKTLDEIMKIISPNIWVKGDDYKVEDILKKHPHLNKIVLLKSIDNKSTTSIINKIKF